MNNYSESDILHIARELVLSSTSLSCGEKMTAVSPDGSTRRFWRLCHTGAKKRFIVTAPLAASHAELAEAEAAWKIGEHLYAKGCAVPQIHGCHRESGTVVFEDLGDVRLQDIVIDASSKKTVLSYYKKVLDSLLHLQTAGGEGFDNSCCWDSPVFDVRLMRQKESDYFLNAFWVDFLGKTPPEGITAEFDYIAAEASRAEAGFFLHRDFQSRNIMAVDGKQGLEFRFIDFQGGCKGPLAYDVASLLLDPYCALERDMQNQLKEYYHAQLEKKYPEEARNFEHNYRYLALQRNMQIIGAFAFLFRVRKKIFFKDFLRPALGSLLVQLEDNSLRGTLPLLHGMTVEGLESLHAVLGES